MSYSGSATIMKCLKEGNMKNTVDHARRQKAVWRVEAIIDDEELAKRIKHRAIDDDITYGDMVIAGLRLYLMQSKKPRQSDTLPL
jgi:hypothetical protein